MIPGIIGKKIGMSQVFTDNGKAEAVTVIEAGPCTVTQIKTAAKEGYEAVQLGYGTAKKLSKAEQGHLKELGKLKELREFRVDSTADVKVGDKVDVNQFKTGDVRQCHRCLKRQRICRCCQTPWFRTADRKHTDKPTVTALRALSARPLRREECSKVCAWPAIWATSRLPRKV